MRLPLFATKSVGNSSLTRPEINAQDDVEESAQAAADKREALALQLQREIEDAQIANARKLEDLVTRLDRELAENQRRLDRELRDQDTHEQRKRELQQESFDIANEEFNLAWDRRLEDLQRRYSEEIATIEQFQNQELNLILDHQRNIARIQQSNRFVNPGGFTGQTGPDNATVGQTQVPLEELRQYAQTLAFQRDRSDLIQAIEAASRAALLNIIASLGGQLPSATPRRDGGPVFAGRNYLFEGREPEVVSFAQNGQVVPMRQILHGAFGAGGGGNVTNNRFEVNQSMLDPSQVSPSQRAIMEQLIMDAIRRVFNGQ